ncbi:MAG: type I methionyl aminopeptidase [Patescibacteria group bacterium]|nr:type I methionyl aminopeptidase [Patescibacteria group bacterium]
MSLITTKEEVTTFRESGKILAGVLRKLKAATKINTRLTDLDELARKLIAESGATPAFLGYRPEGARFPYPYAICTSLNSIAVHGRPTDYRLQSGDVLKIDLGVNYRGAITDSATTIVLGSVETPVKNLLRLTEMALRAGIRAAKVGKTVGDIGFAVERVATAGGVYVLEELGGHGVGQAVHEEPMIYNFGQPGSGMTLKEGMVLAIEPILSLGTNAVVDLPDDSYEAADKSIVAHFEHTVLIGKKEAEILTA